MKSDLYRILYPLRVLGFSLAALAVGGVLYVTQAPISHWVLMLASCLVWPHVALALAQTSTDPLQAEMRNVVVDTAIVGMCVPLVHFNPLVSVILVTISLSDKLNIGRRGLALSTLPWLILPMLVTGLWLRPEPLWHTPTLVIACTLPLVVVHTLAVSLSNRRQLRIAARQNRELQALHRMDAHTDLASRAHWLELADAVLRQGATATALMVDIDQFKSINDHHGHLVGDEVIRAVALAVRRSLRIQDAAGRYGGDELAVLLRGANAHDAAAIAERIRQHVAALRVHELPHLRVSISAGGSELLPTHTSVAEWLADADSALYRAKAQGRNRVVMAPPQTAALQSGAA